MSEAKRQRSTFVADTLLLHGISMGCGGLAYYTYSLEGYVDRHLVGNGQRKVPYTVIWLPPDLKEPLDIARHSRLRVQGEINEHPFNGAWQPAGDQKYYLMIPKPILRAEGLSVGDSVELRFSIADPSEVDVPAALQDAIDQDPLLREKWQMLSPGKQRSFSHRVASAKMQATIQKRIEEVTRMIREGLSYKKGGKIG